MRARKWQRATLVYAHSRKIVGVEAVVEMVLYYLCLKDVGVVGDSMRFLMAVVGLEWRAVARMNVGVLCVIDKRFRRCLHHRLLLNNDLVKRDVGFLMSCF